MGILVFFFLTWSFFLFCVLRLWFAAFSFFLCFRVLCMVLRFVLELFFLLWLFNALAVFFGRVL